MLKTLQLSRVISPPPDSEVFGPLRSHLMKIGVIIFFTHLLLLLLLLLRSNGITNSKDVKTHNFYFGTITIMVPAMVQCNFQMKSV